MRMKIAATILAIAMLPNTVSASFNATVSTEKNSIIVSGDTKSSNVSLTVFNVGYSEEDIINADDAALKNAILYYRPMQVTKGKWSYEVIMPQSAAKEKYIVNADGVSKEVYYAPLSERQDNMIDDAVDALQNDSLSSFLSDNAVYLCDSESYLYVSNTENVSNMAKDILSDKVLTVGSTESLEIIADAINLATAAQLLNEGKIADISALESVADDAKMSIKISDTDKIPSDKHSDVISRVSGGNITSEAAFYNALQESIFIGVINESKELSLQERREFFDSYAASARIDVSNYSTLSETKRDSVVAQLSASKKVTISEMQTRLNELYEQEKPANNNNPPPPSGGGGGGGGAAAPSKPSDDSSNISASGADGNIIAPIATPAPTPFVDNTQPTGEFKDMSSHKWAAEAVSVLQDKGIINGYGDGTFKPEGNITRAEFITMNAIAFLPEYNKQNVSFDDVAVNDWHYKYTMAAYENGIVSGNGYGQFQPNEKIRRSDMAVMLYNLLKYKGIELSETDKSFDDANEIPAYAKSAVAVLRNAGIVNGDENNNFRPNDYASRAEAAVMLHRFMEAVGEV